MITQKQLAERQNHLGGTDLPVILGIDPYKSPYELWLEKTGKVEPEEKSTAAQLAGHILEDGLLKFAAISLGPITKRGTERRIQGTPIKVHIDGIVVSTHEPVEGKTVGVVYGGYHEWGAPNSDEVPHKVTIQCQGHLMAIGNNTRICHVPTILYGRGGFVMYFVPRDDEIIKIIGEQAIKFWELVQKDIPPDERAVSYAVAKRIRRVAQKSITLEPDEVLPYLKAKEELKTAEKTEEALKATLLDKLGDAEVAYIEGLNKSVTFYQQSRPECTIPKTTFRVLRIREEKKR